MYNEWVFQSLELDVYEIYSLRRIILFLTKISQNKYLGYSSGIYDSDLNYMFYTDMLRYIDKDSLLSNICSCNSVVKKCREIHMAHG